ncbi:phosphotransferase enzyme family protein [Paenibacillus cellulositrophicus]|uniref:phosphotransferase enzyme family protein n=1 Tax=Paenibacillus cellulositrophicus TaxID=562959 RepID=UPI0012676A76|nr:phosphotransferase [Paenibacillus cellulositrophicus]
MELLHRALLDAGAGMFGLRNEELEKTHASEHSLIGSYPYGEGRVFLRITEESHKTYAHILGEVQWVSFLAQEGLHVSSPVCSAQGRLAEQISFQERLYTAVCYEGVPGQPSGECAADEDLYKRMGAFMGRMHRISKHYVHQDPSTKRPDWSVEADRVQRIDLPSSERDIAGLYCSLRRYISSLPVTADAYGLIHADFHYGNFFVNEGRLYLIDFDASRYSWFVDDIAVAAFFAGMMGEAGDLGTNMGPHWFLRPFLDGYRTEHDLDERWLREMPYFMKLREMGRYIKLYQACEGDLDRLHPWGRSFMTGRKALIIGSFPEC